MKYLTLFLLLFSLTFAEEFHKRTDPFVLAVTEGEPHLQVAEFVNPITGDFYISRNDLVIEGAEPLKIPMLYVSGDGKTYYKGKVGFEVLGYLRLIWHTSDPYKIDRIIVMEKNGSRLNFDSGLENEYLIDFKEHGIGISNDARGIIGGRTNLQNYRVVRKDKTEVVFYTADGSERVYKFHSKEKEIKESFRFFLLESEKLPNGNRIFYTYDKKGRIKLIKTTNPDGKKIYAWAKLSYLKDSPNFTIQTNDSRHLSYEFNAHTYKDKEENEPSRPAECFVLSKINRNFAPSEKFIFENGKKYDGPRIQTMSLPLDRFITATYYYEGDKDVSLKKDDCRKNRVKTVSAPVGVDKTAVITHRFLYAPNKKKESEFEKPCQTDIFDAYGNKTTILANTACRPLKTKWYEKDKLCIEERSYWDEFGNLQGKLVTDKKDARFAKIYTYDNFGNVISEKFCGNLSGLNNSKKIKLSQASVKPRCHQEYIYEKSIDHLLLCKDGKTSQYQELKRLGTGLYSSKNGEIWRLNKVVGTVAKFQVVARLPVSIESSEISETTFRYYPHHLMAWKKEPNGLKTVFKYLENTDLITVRLTCDGDKIILREFFEYDDDHILIKEIKDNGSSHDPKDLSHVTHRFIKKIIPRTSEHFFGLPSSIEEWYLDAGSEKLLRKVQFDYNSQGKIKRQTVYDSEGKLRYTLHKKYDKQGRVVSETNPLGNIKKYEYDELGNTLVVQEKHLTTHNTYDSANRLIQTVTKGDDGNQRSTFHRYNLKNQKIATIDFNGNQTDYVYDIFGRVIETKLPTSDSITATYDGLGHPISSTNTLGETTTKTYNARGKPTHVSHPDGTEEHYIYNLDGTLKTSLDQLGTKTEYTYDVLGRVTCKTITSQEEKPLSKETWVYNAFHLLSKTDPAGNLTTYEYDGAGRKIAETCVHDSIKYQYDSLGRLIKTFSDNRVTAQDFDLLNRVTEERIEDFEGNILTRTSYGYDTAGNKNEITRYTENGSSTEVTLFDAFKRPIQHVDALGIITTTLYDDAELKKTIIDPQGIKRVETCDLFGRLSTLEIFNPFHELLHKETYTYDGEGNKIEQEVTAIAPGRSPKKIVTSWEYGPLKRLLKLTEAVSTPEQKTTRYSYTIKGMVEKVYKPDGMVLSYTYDPLNRLYELISSDGSCHYRYMYNPQHQPILIEDLIQGTETRRSYDHSSRLISETLATNIDFSSTYDSLGRKTSLLLPDQSSVCYNYDAAFLRQVTRYSAHQKELYSHAYTRFNQNGQLLEEQFIHNLGTQVFKTDLKGRTIACSSPYLESSTFFDSKGQINKIQQDGKTFLFAYDHLSQLTDENNHSYVFDSLHNRILKDGKKFTFNSLHQQTQLSYDLNGNLLSDGTCKYTYDALDRLTTITSLTHHAEFTYDPFHRRLSKRLFVKQNNQWIEHSYHRFLYDDQLEMGAVDSSGSIFELRVLGLGKGAEIGASIAHELQGELYLPIHDLRGNILKLISAKTQKIVETYTYNAFGEEPLSSSKNPWRFSSKRTETEFNLVFYGRRFYSPSLGRWLTPDPKGFTDSMNLYAFVLNNPLLKIDLYGLIAYNFQVSVPISQCIQAIGYSLATIGTHILPCFLGGDQISSLGNYMIGKTADRRHSEFITAGNRNPGNNVRITAVNGILNSYLDGFEIASMISNAHGGAFVHFLYNATHGFFSDILETLLDISGYGSRPARLLANQWRSMIQEFKENGITDGVIYHYAHSQGGAITETALKMLTPEERQYLHVTTFGSASLFSNELAGSVVHYASIKDLVPMAGILNYIKNLFCHILGLQTNVHYIGHFGIPFSDHPIESDTYGSRLIQHGRDFRKEYFGEM